VIVYAVSVPATSFLYWNVNVVKSVVIAPAALIEVFPVVGKYQDESVFEGAGKVGNCVVMS